MQGRVVGGLLFVWSAEGCRHRLRDFEPARDDVR